MNCWHCHSRIIDRDRDIHGNVEITCVVCGRPQIMPRYDALPPDRAAYIETQLLKQTIARRKEPIP